MGFKHSVLLDADKCKGCTHCLRRCPTEAIRVREGRALIDDTSCIDCGECIRVCPYKAKKAVTDRLGDLDGSKHLIALPAPSLFGQVQNLEDGDYVLQGLLDMGFDDVFEVSKAAELITEQTRRFMKDPRAVYPLISSACPVIVRLIALRFPSLSRHVVPVMPPIELAGLMAREEALKKHPQLRDEDIRTVFISPCPAKNSWIKNLEEGQPRQYVDYVISMSEVYFPLIEAMDPHKIPQRISESGMVGMGWAVSGGEGSALMNDRYLAADGIENVIRVLDSIENGNISGVDFIELLACAGGCVGGVLTVEDPYIAKGRLQTLRRYMPVTRNHLPPGTGPRAGGVPDGAGGRLQERIGPERKSPGVHPHDDGDRTDPSGAAQSGLRLLRRPHLPGLCRRCGAGADGYKRVHLPYAGAAEAAYGGTLPA